jgi:phosphate-selective porin OprO and OprP
MSLSSRPSVYKIGRITILIAGLMCVCPALSFAQEAGAADAASTSTAAPPPAPSELSAELARRLDELDQRARITDRKLELAQEAAAQKPPSDGVSADERGFVIKSGDKAFEIRLHGHIQLDARRAFGTTDYALQDKDTFLVRRARLIFESTAIGLVDFRIMPDFGNNTTALYDAFLDAHPAPWLRLRAGKFKPPIGLERLQADNNLVFNERALDSNLSAQRDVGLELWGDIANAAIHYELAILNGNPDGTLNDVDDEHAKTYAGRLFLRPFQLGGLRWLGDLGVGLAVETGNEKGSSTLTGGVATNNWLPTFKSEGQNTIYTYATSATDTNAVVFASHRHTRVNPQLYYYNGPVGLLAEWVHEYQEVDKGGAIGAVNHQAGHVTASWVIGGENSFDGVRPARPADWTRKDIGAVEVAFRFNWIDFDDLGFRANTFADQTKSVTAAKGFGVGVNWWLSRNIKVSGSLAQTTFTGGAGTSQAIANRPKETEGFARFQLAF